MLLYVIRHGDPIYNPDSLTEKGKIQAEALAKRLAVHGFDRIFSSPLLRARQTAQPTCDLLGITYTVEDWTSEDLAYCDFSMIMPDGSRRWCFDQQTTLLKNDDTLQLGENWHQCPCFAGYDLKKGYDRIIEGSDDFLERLGYRREGSIYKILRSNNERVAVFCHQGFGLTWMSHLLQIPPHIFWSSFDITHTGFSIFQFSNYADGYTSPKCLCFSDTSHLYKEGLDLKYNNEIDI
ncbi:MAG: histidine phosphatase family protein [Clostridiales bacterium]|jgi:broad specificity phosphatase PhoE|nr:histidine phosphatase family protein [Clostridiales bacterium]